MSVWRERMRAHADSAYVHVIVNEGKEAGASLPHTHAQLYALPFVPAAVARERERFTAYSDRTQGRNLLEDVVQEEVRRRERVFAIDDEAVALCPFGARVPFHFQIVPRRPAARFSDDGPLGARLLHESLTRLGADAGPAAAAQHVGAHGPARRRALLLAHRGDAAPGAARRPRDRHRRAPERAGAGGRGRAAARRRACRFPPPDAARPPPGPHVRGRAAAGAAALRALGRGARRAVRRRRARTGIEVEVGGHRLVPRAHLERPHLRARPPRRRATARCSATCPTRASTRAPRPPTSRRAPTSPRRPPSRTPTGRSTCPTRRSASGAAPRAGAAWSRSSGAWRWCRTGWWPPPSSGPRPPTSASWSDDRFTLVSVDAYTGDYVEVRLYGARGAELARESLYEDE